VAGGWKIKHHASSSKVTHGARVTRRDAPAAARVGPKTIWTDLTSDRVRSCALALTVDAAPVVLAPVSQPQHGSLRRLSRGLGGQRLKSWCPHRLSPSRLTQVGSGAPVPSSPGARRWTTFSRMPSARGRMDVHLLGTSARLPWVLVGGRPRGPWMVMTVRLPGGARSGCLAVVVRRAGMCTALVLLLQHKVAQ